MGKQAGAYRAEDQSILPVLIPMGSHLTRNHRRQPVTPAPITLMAWDSLLLALAPQQTPVTPGTWAALPGASREAAGRPIAAGASWEKKVSCSLPAAAAPKFQGGLFSLLIDFFAYIPARWPKSHTSVDANPAKHRKPLHPAPPNCRHSSGTPKRSQQRCMQRPYPLYMGERDKSRCILSQLRTLLLFLGSCFPGQAEFLVICC